MKHVLGAKLLALPRRGKQVVLVVLDVAIIEFAIWVAFALRLETFAVPFEPIKSLALTAPFLALPIFIWFGLYRAIMRFVGLHALATIVQGVVLYSILLTAAIYLLSIPGVPRSITPIQCLVTMLLIGSSRAVGRQWLSNIQNGRHNTEVRRRLIIYGAGSAGVQLASALHHSRELQPVAFIDDDAGLQYKQIGALKVHAPEDLPELIESHDVVEILLAIPSVTRQRRNAIIDQLAPLSITVRTLPGVAELAQGKISISDLRDVDVEDLLGRDPIAPDPQLLNANITGKSVMVTGAGGSIGAELCRQILAQSPARLVLYELSEFALYAIEQELLRRQHMQSDGTAQISPLLGSVCDQTRLERALSHFSVETVFHAAAYKHVPMVEMNPCEGAYNNVIGTLCAAQAALSAGVDTFVLISTDKAVRPTNTMGTTKRLAEMVLQALAAEFPDRTRYTMVRFGNVLGSSGSVIPLFRQQIKNGGPITVTDPRIIRFFMTIPEAAQLVIQAGAMGQDGDVFVLDMGEPVKILDLAHRMIHLSGLSVKDDENPEGDIEITFSGLRPGEKLYEELLIGDNVIPTRHPRIRKANELCLGWPELKSVLDDLRIACTNDDSNGLRAILRRAVPEFVPQCDNQDVLLEQENSSMRNQPARSFMPSAPATTGTSTHSTASAASCVGPTNARPTSHVSVRP